MVFVRNSEPVGRLTVVGEQIVSHAVGSVTQSFKNVSRDDMCAPMSRPGSFVAPSLFWSRVHALVLEYTIYACRSMEAIKTGDAEAKLFDSCIDLSHPPSILLSDNLPVDEILLQSRDGRKVTGATRHAKTTLGRPDGGSTSSLSLYRPQRILVFHRPS